MINDTRVCSAKSRRWLRHYFVNSAAAAFDGYRQFDFLAMRGSVSLSPTPQDDDNCIYKTPRGSRRRAVGRRRGPKEEVLLSERIYRLGDTAKIGLRWREKVWLLSPLR